jgi:acetyltransferase-like isoleucine patch superfamily enzyme
VPGRRSPHVARSETLLLLNARIRLRKCEVGRRTRVRGRPRVIKDGSITIGDHVRLVSDLVPIELHTVGGGSIEIGDWTFVNYGSIVTAYARVEIGRNCLLGHYVAIIDNDEHDMLDRSRPGLSRPVRVADGAWLCDRVIVLPGVTIGEGAVVGAGAVVTKDIPPWSVAVGNPARVIKQIPRLSHEPQAAALAGLADGGTSPNWG